MASIIFGIIGGIIGGPVGAAIGAAIGGYIDSEFLFPAIFGEPAPLVGPRIDDLGIQTSSEGSPINTAYGPTIRFGGTVLWFPDLIEVSKTQSGGKGGGGSSSTTYKYFANVAIGICEGPISHILRIWADGKVIFTRDADTGVEVLDARVKSLTIYSGDGQIYPDLVEGQIADPLIEAEEGAATVPPFKGVAYFVIERLELESWGNRLPFFTFLVEADPPGYTAGDVIDAVLQSASLVPAQFDVGSLRPFTITNMVHVSDTQITTITLTSDGVGHEMRIGDVVTVQKVLPSEFNRTYVIETVDPDAGEIEVLHDPSPSDSYLSGGRLTPPAIGDPEVPRSINDYPTFDGVYYHGPQPTTKKLEVLLMSFDIVVKESAGKLVFTQKKDLSQGLVIPEGDLAARQSGDEAPPALPLTDIAGFDIPSEVVVNFQDSLRKYQQGSQRERRIDWVTRIVQSVDIRPIVRTAAQARNICKRLLWRAWNERRSYRLSLPPSYIHLEETDRVSCVYEGNPIDLRIKEMERGANFLTNFAGTVVGVEGQFSSLFEGGDFDDGDQIYTPPPMTLHLLNLPALREVDNLVPVFYITASVTDPNRRFASAIVTKTVSVLVYHQHIYFPHFHKVIQFQEIAAIAVEGTMGITITNLGTSSAGGIDTGNTLTIELLQGVIESTFTVFILAGHNLALIGNELITFRDVELIGLGPNDGKLYQISGMMRGLRDTGDEIDNHTIGERVVILDEAWVHIDEISPAEFGIEEEYKIVPSGAEAEELEGVQFTPSGASVRPFSPGHGVGKRDLTTDDVEFTWFRRSRSILNLLDVLTTGNLPIHEVVEIYEVDVYLSGVVVATYTLQAQTNFTYTAALQTIDGLTPGDPVVVDVSQVSEPTALKGKPLRITSN